MPTRDFTAAKAAAADEDPIEFTIDADTFRALDRDTIPAWAIVDLTGIAVLAGKQEGKGAEDMATGDVVELLKGVLDFMDMVLEEDSAKRFAARMRDKRNPITLTQATDASMWLVSEIYARPTVPS